MEDSKEKLTKEVEFCVKILKSLIPMQEYIQQIALILITEKACPQAIFLCGRLMQLLEVSLEKE